MNNRNWGVKLKNATKIDRSYQDCEVLGTDGQEGGEDNLWSYEEQTNPRVPENKWGQLNSGKIWMFVIMKHKINKDWTILNAFWKQSCLEQGFPTFLGLRTTKWS